MEKKKVVLILVVILIVLIAAGFIFSDFFKVLFGVTGNTVQVIG